VSARLDPAALLLVCLVCPTGGRFCLGRVGWARSDAGGFVGTCARCKDQRRAVSGEQPQLEQLEREGRICKP